MGVDFSSHFFLWPYARQGYLYLHRCTCYRIERISTKANNNKISLILGEWKTNQVLLINILSVVCRFYYQRFFCLFVFFHLWINVWKVLIFALIVFTHLKKAVERNSQNIASNDQYYWLWEYLNVATNLKRFAFSFFKELQEKFHNESRFRVAILVQELIIPDILMSLSEPKIEQHLKSMGGSIWKKG